MGKIRKNHLRPLAADLVESKKYMMKIAGGKRLPRVKLTSTVMIIALAAFGNKKDVM
jgi:hypothetical protein